MNNRCRVITLLTDFGLSDVYVGVMKGVMAQVNPAVRVIDLTHQVPPQDIAAARFCLMNAYPYFPAGTVHVAVVDPGVGSGRRAIAVELEEGFLVGPDNGLFGGVLSRHTAIAAVELTNARFWRSGQPSSTFHGRDIFAPVAAHLASEVALQELGPAIDLQSLVQLPLPSCTLSQAGILGCVQYCDRFGNLITNIPASAVAGKTWAVVVGDREIMAGSSYSDRPSGELLALVGSHGWVEVAVNGGSAQTRLQLGYGDAVEVSVNEIDPR
ncbi:MAG TPA: SAM-dependent chlorinase/fluorinase [Candidatus Obscuribacterales bacterium]